MKPTEKSPQPTKLQRIIALVLTLAFVPTIFAAGIFGLINDHETILGSVRASKARFYLTDKEDMSFFPMTKARIQSLQTALGDSVGLREELGHINASFQYVLGKELVVAGSEQLLSLPNDQIYALTERETLAPEAMEAAEFIRQLQAREIPTLFAYIHPQFYDGGTQLPAGYLPLDTGDELADEVLSIVAETGVRTLDSREFVAEFGLTEDELILKTDMHWTALAALRTTQRFAQEINDLTGSALDVSRIALENLDATTHEDLFLGEYGQQVGAHNAGMDDIVVYTPKYETSLTRHTVEKNWAETDVSGSFAEAVIKQDTLVRTPGEPNVLAYADYGLVEKLEVIDNLGDDCEDMTIMIFRDSYTAPVGSFLSLLAKRVVMVDMRAWDRSAMSFVDEYDPDVVLFSYSRQMYEDHGYDLGVGYREIVEQLNEG